MSVTPIANDPDSGKRFLLSCLTEQAQLDGVSLSDIEKRMFLFSETSGETDWEANKQFEAQHNDAEYESKIAKLLHSNYIKTKKSEESLSMWQTALQSVRDEDFYGLVMVDKARIPRPKPHASIVAKTILQGFFSMANRAFFAARALIVIAALFFLVDPLHLGLIRSDFPKLLCVALAAGALWVVGQIERRSFPDKVED